MEKLDRAIPTLCFLAGMWTMAMLTSVMQSRYEAFVGLLVAPFIAGAILFLINHFGLKWLGRK